MNDSPRIPAGLCDLVIVAQLLVDSGHDVAAGGLVQDERCASRPGNYTLGGLMVCGKNFG